MTQSHKNNIAAYQCHIDLDNLCGGNDYAALTDKYDRKEIQKLIWSIADDRDRSYVTQAIFLQKKLDECPIDNFEDFESLTKESVNLQREYAEGRPKAAVEKSATAEESTGNRYNTTDLGVLFYTICNGYDVHFDNNDTKNCEQSKAKAFLSKISGYSPASFKGKICPDYADSATRKSMKKIFEDTKDIMPAVANELKRQYNDFEDDFDNRERRKKIEKMMI